MLWCRARAPIAQLAEAADLKSAKCRFESDWGHPASSRFTAMLLYRLIWIAGEFHKSSETRPELAPRLKAPAAT